MCIYTYIYIYIYVCVCVLVVIRTCREPIEHEKVEKKKRGNDTKREEATNTWI